MEDLHCKLENMKPLCVFSVTFTGSIDTDTELHCGYSGPCHSIVVCDFVHQKLGEIGYFHTSSRITTDADSPS